jgi:hypothetical protein
MSIDLDECEQMQRRRRRATERRAFEGDRYADWLRDRERELNRTDAHALTQLNEESTPEEREGGGKRETKEGRRRGEERGGGEGG